MGLLTALLSQELPENQAWRGRGRRSRARRPGNGAWPPYGADDDFYSASPPLVAGSVADSDLLRRQQQVNREAGDRPAAGHRRHGLGVPRLAEGRAAWPGRGYLLPRGRVLRQRPAAGGTTLLFTHACWQQASKFMSGCSTNWGAYLTSLKTGAESDAFAAYPAGEISRWD